MKRILVLSIYMFAMVTGIATYANASSKDGGRKKSEITLTLNDVKEGQLLSIKDVNGAILYNSTIATSGLYNNKFDLTALPNGKYYFEHEKGFELKIIPFTVSIGEVTFNKKNEKTIYKPVLDFKNNTLYLTKLELDQDNVQVKIYYANEKNNSDFNLIHSENITETTNIKRIYRLAEKRTGNYKVIINANGRDYVEYFTI